MKNINVHWIHEDKKNIGMVTFEELENGNVMVSFENVSGQLIESGEVSQSIADDIQSNIEAAGFDMTNMNIFE